MPPGTYQVPDWISGTDLSALAAGLSSEDAEGNFKATAGFFERNETDYIGSDDTVAAGRLLSLLALPTPVRTALTDPLLANWVLARYGEVEASSGGDAWTREAVSSLSAYARAGKTVNDHNPDCSPEDSRQVELLADRQALFDIEKASESRPISKLREAVLERFGRMREAIGEEWREHEADFTSDPGHGLYGPFTGLALPLMEVSSSIVGENDEYFAKFKGAFRVRTAIAIDDEDPGRWGRYLDALGFLVPQGMKRTYADPAEAREALKKHKGRVDLVLCDLEMPGMTGVELRKKVPGRKIRNFALFSYNEQEIDRISKEGKLNGLAYYKRLLFSPYELGAKMYFSFFK
jgi:hypothetical protein